MIDWYFIKDISYTLPVYLASCLPFFRFTLLPVYLSFCLPIVLSTYLPFYLSNLLHVCLSCCLPVNLYFCLDVNMFICQPTPCPPVYLSTCLPVYLSTCILVYLSTCLLVYLSIVYISLCFLVTCPHVIFIKRPVNSFMTRTPPISRSYKGGNEWKQKHILNQGDIECKEWAMVFTYTLMWRFCNYWRTSNSAWKQ